MMNAEPFFSPTISNEQLAVLPTIHFEGEIVIVETEKVLLEACEYLSRQPVIGFDTESRPSFKARVTNKVALLQLSSPERCYLIRLCRVPMKRPLLRLLESRQTIKVGTDVAGDIRALNQLRHFRAGGFVDLQVLAPQWGIEEKSLRKLSAITLGKRVSKAQRLSNWEAARLTQQQLSYAATDAWVCLEILNTLSAVPQLSGKTMHADTDLTATYTVADQPSGISGHADADRHAGDGATPAPTRTKTAAKPRRKYRPAKPQQAGGSRCPEPSETAANGNSEDSPRTKSGIRSRRHVHRKPRRSAARKTENREQTK